ncbi:hypothetical protein HC766_07265 [Candidatus Gracilibacteria bacterium]|nr:hypothetical protein [Candidatus Gracilibacteria bacterium]NJS42034.1 hypothetical protein [Candidatus Gracilibacteria bacterium]
MILTSILSLSLFSCGISKQNTIYEKSTKTSHQKNINVQSLFDREYIKYINKLQEVDGIDVTKLDQNTTNSGRLQEISIAYCDYLQNEISLNQSKNNPSQSQEISLSQSIEALSKSLSWPSPPYISVYVSDLSIKSFCTKYSKLWQNYNQKYYPKELYSSKNSFLRTIDQGKFDKLYTFYSQKTKEIGLEAMTKQKLQSMGSTSCSMIETKGINNFAIELNKDMISKSYNDIQIIILESQVVMSTYFYCPHRSNQIKTQIDLINPKDPSLLSPDLKQESVIQI